MDKYTNRYGNEFTFTKQEDGNVLWEGEFSEIVRTGFDEDGNTIFVDPSGGPFIKQGQMLCHITHGEINVIVESFERTDKGYLIKCKEHKVDPNDTSHLADTKIIGGIINTSYK